MEKLKEHHNSELLDKNEESKKLKDEFREAINQQLAQNKQIIEEMHKSHQDQL